MDILLRELGKVKALLPGLQLEGIRKRLFLISAYPPFTPPALGFSKKGSLTALLCRGGQTRTSLWISLGALFVFKPHKSKTWAISMFRRNIDGTIAWQVDSEDVEVWHQKGDTSP